MATKTVQDSSLTAIADAIRAKTGKSASMQFPGEFVSEIGSIETGGGVNWDDIASGDAPAGDIVLDTCTHVRNYAIHRDTVNSPWGVYGPEVIYLGENAFRGNTYMTYARFPKLTTIHNTGHIFYGNTRLALVDWGSAPVRGNNFTSCSNLKTLILRSMSVQAANNINVLNGTPFDSGGTGGTIYIPKSLYDELGTGSSLDYKAATNWSTIDGYGTITWAQIEGSQYETHYADGTVIQT